ncbi:hypothetical protein B0H63DRAFT_409912 [Podospora didyma]|uniref:NAD(P)-binding domain-containing protein n=1 Tax=Podospora didyma TaxID=330526 RepID=A0AAE0NZ34_9PEZI|nr:hypothetical protein B0H63DRAFT_409912 [Podospora didyma]
MSVQYAKDQPKGFTNSIERVAIVGATGNVGKHFAESLLKTGKHTVTAITRSGSKNPSDLPKGLKVAEVDYNDESSLVAALKGQQFLVITMSVMAPPDTHEKLVVAAAKAGVPYVMPNAYGGDITNEKLNSEGMHGTSVKAHIGSIEKQGVSAWVAMCCSFWYEWSVSAGSSAYGFDIKEKTVTFYDEGTEKINTSTWEQCGRALAALLSLKELPEDESDKSPTLSQWKNKPFYVSSFLVSQRDILDSLHRVLGTTDADWKISYENSGERYKGGIEAMQKGDRSGFVKAMYVRAFFPTGDGNFEAKHGTANGVLGLPKEDLDEATKRAAEMATGDFWSKISYGPAK